MAKNKIDAKEIGLTVLLGSSVVVLTPLVAGVLSGVEFMAFEIIPGLLSVGTAISAGVSAFVADLAITKWLR